MSLVWRAPLVGVLVLAACAHGGREPASATGLPTEGEWRTANARLAALRTGEPDKPFGAVVQVTLHEPRSGRTLTARGAIAVDPHHAMRMILLGPGGQTAVDVWATADRWRFSAPPANVLRRGEREDDRALPIGFFRWWFLAPLEGRLLTSVAYGARERFILRGGSATFDVSEEPVATGHAITASRLADGVLDKVSALGSAFGVRPGDHATYDQGASGIHVEVTVESEAGAPDPIAFVDPDAAIPSGDPPR